MVCLRTSDCYNFLILSFSRWEDLLHLRSFIHRSLQNVLGGQVLSTSCRSPEDNKLQPDLTEKTVHQADILDPEGEAATGGQMSPPWRGGRCTLHKMSSREEGCLYPSAKINSIDTAGCRPNNDFRAPFPSPHLYRRQEKFSRTPTALLPGRGARVGSTLKGKSSGLPGCQAVRTAFSFLKNEERCSRKPSAFLVKWREMLCPSRPWRRPTQRWCPEQEQPSWPREEKAKKIQEVSITSWAARPMSVDTNLHSSYVKK